MKRNGGITCLGIASMLAMLVSASDVSAEQRRKRSERCYGVLVSSNEDEKSSRRRGTRSFSASEILDLQVRVLVPRRLEGDHELELKFFTPSGHLYQELAVPVAANEDSHQASSRRRRWLRRYHIVTGTLPVGGSTIVTSSLYGQWRVEAYLNGAESSCARPRSFVLEP